MTGFVEKIIKWSIVFPFLGGREGGVTKERQENDEIERERERERERESASKKVLVANHCAYLFIY